MDDEDATPSFPFSWRAALYTVADAASAVLAIASHAVSDIAAQVAADHNYQIDRRTFAEQAALEIESMTEGE